MISRPDPRSATAPEDDVLAGLRARAKHLPCRLLYDARGAELFEQICTVEDYYLTRSELALLETHLPALADEIGPRARVIEPGSGAGVKTRMLLGALDAPASYVPIDVSLAQLEDTARTLRDQFAGLDVQPVNADYTRPFALPRARAPYDRMLVFFPGSTIGNFEPDEARRFLARLGELAGARALLLLGADSNTDPASLVRAYDDREGITAAFDRNVLAHVNHAYGARFDLDAFEHRAVWNAACSRIEMHLVSRVQQTVLVGGEPIDFAAGEPIVTEHCYKHRPELLAELLAGAGWTVRTVHADEAGRMRLWLAGR